MSQRGDFPDCPDCHGEGWHRCPVNDGTCDCGDEAPCRACSEAGRNGWGEVMITCPPTGIKVTVGETVVFTANYIVPPK